jgi:hypothetical protein
MGHYLIALLPWDRASAARALASHFRRDEPAAIPVRLLALLRSPRPVSPG